MCGIADEPFWPLPNSSSTSRTSVRARWRSSTAILSRLDAISASVADERRVAVALHDLRRDRLEADAEARADVLLELRRQVREGADGAGDLADRGLVERALEPHALAPHLLAEDQQLEPEGGGLGVHAVGAADAGRVAELERARAQHGVRRSTPASSRRAGVADLERQRGVDHVGRRHAVVDEARRRADVLGDVGQERDHVVAHARLDLGDARRRRSAARARISASASGGISPRSASTSQTASSTSSQRARRPSSVQIAFISGRA